MTITHLLIDLDGTISDSAAGIGCSLRVALEACGYPAPSDDQVQAMIGPPFELTLPKLGVADADVERVIDAYRLRYEDVGLYENEVYAGIPEALATLAGEYTLAIATAKPEATARRIVEHFELHHHFEVVVGASQNVGGGRRTKGQVITHALGVLGVEAGSHVLMIGDRDHDVDGARANGLDCLGVAWGFGSREELEGAGAVAVVDEPGEVVEAVRGAYRLGSR